MKKTITFLYLISFSIFAFAQNDCQEFLDMMLQKAKQKDLKSAKKVMKDYKVCVEEKQVNNQIINSLNNISYIIDKKEGVFIVENLDGKISITNENFQTIFTIEDNSLNYVNYKNGRLRLHKLNSSSQENEFYIYANGIKINSKGYFYLSDFKENYAVVKVTKNDKIGFLDGAGNIKYTDYNTVFPFNDGISVVMNYTRDFNIVDDQFNKLWKKDKKLIYCTPFYNGIATIQDENGKSGKIDLEGDITYYDGLIISPFIDGVAIAKKNEKYGLINSDFTEITGFKYSKITLGNIDFSRDSSSISPFQNWFSSFYEGYTYDYGRLKFYDKNYYDKVYIGLINKQEYFINKSGICVKNCSN